MLLPTDSSTGPFRVTLFFGPDVVDDDDRYRRCVFNVKKRSWKGGVQVSVDLSSAQVGRIRTALGLELWMTKALKNMAVDERGPVAQRMEDVFIQYLCARKLDLALGAGVEPRNQTIPSDALVSELDEFAVAQRESMYAWMRAELDLDDASSNP